MSIPNYKPQKPFRFWCQKILPTEYDDSLSYYELLTKVVEYLNKTNANIEALAINIEEYNVLVDELHEYVETYFDNLNVQEEINTKLDEMAEDGTLTSLIAPLIPSIVEDWLRENITGGEYPGLDSTLLIEGMAADSKAVGERFKTAISYTSYNGVDKLGNQTVNTVCRVYQPQIEATPENPDSLVTDTPTGVVYGTNSTYYGWLYTAGGANYKMQYLFDPHTERIYYRFRRQVRIPDTNPPEYEWKWTEWFGDKNVKYGSYEGVDKLGNQPINTICRVYQPDIQATPENPDRLVTDTPTGVVYGTNSTYYGWLYTVGGTNHRMQYLFDPHTERIYFRFRRQFAIPGTDPVEYEWKWAEWYGNENLKLDTYVGVDKLGNQTVNTVCRIYQPQIQATPENPDQLVTDTPTGVVYGTNSTYYGWLYTMGGTNNRMQYLFDPHTERIYFRFRRQFAIPDTNPTEYEWKWAEWFGDENIKFGSYDGGNVLGKQSVNTMCRVYKVRFDVDVAEPESFGAPEDVDVLETVTRDLHKAPGYNPNVPDDDESQPQPGSDGYYVIHSSDFPAWVITVGGTNKIQIMYYIHNRAMYFRIYRSIGGGQYDWSTWANISESGGGSGGSGSKSMKILAIGNSFTQDSMAYLPKVLEEALPDYIINCSILYNGGASVVDYATWGLDTHYSGALYNTWNTSTKKWTRLGGANVPTLRTIMTNNEWDAIIIQATSEDLLDEYNSSTGVTTTAKEKMNAVVEASRELLNMLQEVAVKPFNLMWLQWMGRPATGNNGGTPVDYSSFEMYRKIVNACNVEMSNIGCCDVIPVGAAIQNARTNPTLVKLGSIPAITVAGNVTTGATSIPYESTENVSKNALAEKIVKFGSDETEYVIVSNTGYTAGGTAGTITLATAISNDITSGASITNVASNLLYSDGLHMQAGICPLLGAYTMAVKMLEYSGNKITGIYGCKWYPTDSNTAAIHARYIDGGVVKGLTHGSSEDGGVAEVNGTATQDSIENVRMAQEIAVQAVKYPKFVTVYDSNVNYPIDGDTLTVNFSVSKDSEDNTIYTCDTPVKVIRNAAMNGITVKGRIDVAIVIGVATIHMIANFALTQYSGLSVVFSSIIGDSGGGQLTAIPTVLEGFEAPFDVDEWHASDE